MRNCVKTSIQINIQLNMKIRETLEKNVIHLWTTANDYIISNLSYAGISMHCQRTRRYFSDNTDNTTEIWKS